MKKILRFILICIVVTAVYIIAMAFALKFPHVTFLSAWIGGVVSTALGIITYLWTGEL